MIVLPHSAHRNFWLANLFVAALLFPACEDAPPSSPNILLITVDTLRADPLACYGGEAGLGENICSLGRHGTRYAWALSAAPSTAPALASIMTSRYPSYHGVTQFFGTQLTFNGSTLAESFTKAGYATAAIISNPVLAPSRGLNRGFASYDVQMNREEPNRPGLWERDAQNATDAALDWIEEAPEPWFIWIHYQDPHGPYSPPDARAIADEPGARRLEVLTDHSGYGGIPNYQALPGVFSVDAYKVRYHDEIRYLDNQIGRLLGDAEEFSTGDLGVLLTADHGEALGEDSYWFAHGHSVGIEQVRVPLLWRPPGGSPAQVDTTPINTLDVAPTLLAAARVPIPDIYQGSPLPTQSTKPASGRAERAFFTEHRARAGLVVGNVYYTRDRLPITGPLLDRITGGILKPIPQRSVRLSADGALPTSALSSAEALEEQLEGIMVSFLEQTQYRQEPTASDLSEDLQDQLSALGYLE
jgi:arylsulfatase A-like enzyme